MDGRISVSMLCRRALAARPLLRRGLCVLSRQPSLARHLDTLVAKHADIEATLADGSTAFCADRMRELSRLTPIVEAHAEALKLTRELEELKSLAKDASAEDDLRELAKAELDESSVALDELEDRLTTMIVPPAAGDERSAIIEVRAGVGGSEAALFAAEMLTMYERFAKLQSWRFEVLEHAEMDGGGLRDATATVDGVDAYGLLRFESGVHRVQRVPATESLGRVHTSTAVVVVLPAADDKADGLVLRDADVIVDTMRAGGAGGQQVNTTDSAVRLTHKETGIKVGPIANERSQHQNKASAFKLLTARVQAHFDAIEAEKNKAARDEVESGGSRSERIRTYNWADDRITDHRIGLSLFGIDKMLNGELLGEMTDELGAQMRLRRREAFLRRLDAEDKASAK